MEKRLNFGEYNFCLIDFYAICKECDSDIISALHSYSLLHPSKKLTKDVRSIIMHHIILQLCETILQYRGKEKCVIYFTNYIPSEITLNEYFNNLPSFFDKLLSLLQKNLPIRILKNHIPFNQLKHLRQGEREELIIRVRNVIGSFDFANFTFSKVNIFTKRHNLMFLNKEYFKTLKSKQLLLT